MTRTSGLGAEGRGVVSTQPGDGGSKSQLEAAGQQQRAACHDASMPCFGEPVPELRSATQISWDKSMTWNCEQV